MWGFLKGGGVSEKKTKLSRKKRGLGKNQGGKGPKWGIGGKELGRVGFQWGKKMGKASRDQTKDREKKKRKVSVCLSRISLTCWGGEKNQGYSKKLGRGGAEKDGLSKFFTKGKM